VHGVVSCGYRRAAEVVALRSVLSPLCCLCTMLAFGLRGEPLRIMVLQGALPQAVSSFVVFKEFKSALRGGEHTMALAHAHAHPLLTRVRVRPAAAQSSRRCSPHPLRWAPRSACPSW
jgi:hypothetical protein